MFISFYFILFYFISWDLKLATPGSPRKSGFRGNFEKSVDREIGGSGVCHSAEEQEAAGKVQGLPIVGCATPGCRNKKLKRPVPAPVISFSLGPTLWPPVKASSWHPRRVLVGQVRRLAIPTQPFICTHHTQGAFEWALKNQSSAYSSFGARFIFVPQDNGCAPFPLAWTLGNLQRAGHLPLWS